MEASDAFQRFRLPIIVIGKKPDTLDETALLSLTSTLHVYIQPLFSGCFS